MKRSAPNTPNQVKTPVQINSEQKQNFKINKNKRKSLPASLANGDDGSSLKKKKPDPFSGTSDLFMQMKQENVKKEKGESDNKSPAKGKKQKQPNSNTNDKADETKPQGERKQRRLEKLKARRIAGKKKLKDTFTQARDGDETAINHLKESLTKLLTKGKLTHSSNRKFKKMRKVLMEGGVDVSSFKLPAAQTTQKTEKQQNKAAQQKTKSAGPQKGATANTDKKGAAQLQKQNKKQGIKKEIKVEVESDEDEDDSEDESEEENDNSLIEAESIEDEGEEEEDDEEAGEQEESEEEEEDDDEAAEEEDDDDEEEEDSDEEEVPSKKAKVDKKQNGKPGQNQSNDSVSSLLKGKSRYVLFVGNLPFDVTKEDISQHFAKIGSVKDVRIPLDKQTNKCRGFGYVEMPDQTTYEKALSLHHTNLKGRRINVEYTQGGKKKGEEKKKEIKAKNFKLQAMRQGGKLTGSVKQSQKRAARREKRRSANK